MANNRQIVLKQRPVGAPKESDFELREAPIPEPQEGQVLVRTAFISVDPYMRGRISGRKSYIDPIPVDGVMEGGSAGYVVTSRHPDFTEGEPVHGMWGWQEFAVVDADQLHAADLSLGPLSYYLGVLGMPGMTSWFGLLDVGQPKEGDTVFISGAAGAVGSVAGQIAKIHGCTVVGSAGSQDKVDFLLNDCGFDAAFNYKDDKDYFKVLERLCPKGIDVYFDNVGGPITDAAIMNFNENARFSICGQIDQYNDTQIPNGPRLYFQFIVKRVTARGFLVFDFVKDFPRAQRQIARWLEEGRITFRETMTDGLENTPKAFIGLFHGENTGKQLVRLPQ
ncbi:MAG: NADP-dependent oxidoreductase [Candidatus Hydrogenedentes bacterium]|nr:NADP-dependent oxidoreductase [Candidatus Hydrogenedentota bacterium]